MTVENHHHPPLETAGEGVGLGVVETNQAVVEAEETIVAVVDLPIIQMVVLPPLLQNLYVMVAM